MLDFHPSTSLSSFLRRHSHLDSQLCFICPVTKLEYRCCPPKSYTQRWISECLISVKSVLCRPEPRSKFTHTHHLDLLMSHSGLVHCPSQFVSLFFVWGPLVALLSFIPFSLLTSALPHSLVPCPFCPYDLMALFPYPTLQIAYSWHSHENSPLATSFQKVVVSCGCVPGENPGMSAGLDRKKGTNSTRT